MNRRLVASFRSVVGAVVVGAVVVAGAGAGCTSFAFKRGGKDEAPDRLTDRARMVTIGGGTYEMGFQNGEPDEFPPHRVSLDGFLIDKHEVTIGDFTACVEARVCKPPRATVALDVKDETLERHPVTGVSWYEAERYCTWVGKRLPTEAEWEYAARQPRMRPFPWEGAYEVNKLNGRGDADGFARTAPVCSFESGNTATGVCDMAGNAAEWTADWYESTYYQKSPPQNPKGPEASTGARTIRGGSWSDTDYLHRSTARQAVDPNVGNDAVGFRCAG